MPNSDLAKAMLQEFGPLMGGEELRRALGYRTWAAFARAVRMDGIGIRVFEIPNRRGRFALTADVAEWLLKVRGSNEVSATTNAEISTTERRKS